MYKTQINTSILSRTLFMTRTSPYNFQEVQKLASGYRNLQIFLHAACENALLVSLYTPIFQNTSNEDVAGTCWAEIQDSRRRAVSQRASHPSEADQNPCIRETRATPYSAVIAQCNRSLIVDRWGERHTLFRFLNTERMFTPCQGFLS